MNDLQELQALLQELLDAIAYVTQSGEDISDEFQLELARTLEILYSRIEELLQSPVESLPPNINPEEQLTEGMPSSNVESFGYDEKTRRLLVRFLGDYPNRHGPIYAYKGVPRNIFEIFRSGSIPARTDGRNRWGKWWRGKVPSLGASLFTLIKQGTYPYERLA